MLSILYLPENQDTSMLKSYIGNTEGLLYPRELPPRNYDDVLDAWETLWKTHKIGSDDVHHAWITQGGEWNGKFMIGGDTSMARVHYWDKAKPKDAKPVDVLGPFWIGHWQKTMPTAPLVDDLNIVNDEDKSDVEVSESGVLTEGISETKDGI